MISPEPERLAALSRAIRGSTLKRFRAIPHGSENWRCAPSALSVAEIAEHLLDADRWLFRKLREPELPHMVAAVGADPLEDRGSYDRLLSELHRAGEKRAELLLGLQESDLAREIPDQRFEGEVTTWWVIMRGNLDHEVHHRGQLATYLAILRAGEG